MTQRVITGNILKPDGTPFVGKAAATFSLLAEVYSGGIVYPMDNIPVMTDAVGAFSVSLAVPDTGTAPYRITFADGYAADFNLAAGISVDLETLVTIATSAVLPSALQILLDAAAVLTFKTVTSTYVVLPTDVYIRCNGTFTVTLPPATGSALVYVIKNVGTGIITIDGDGADTIDGAATYFIYQNCTCVVIDVAAGVWDVL